MIFKPPPSRFGRVLFAQCYATLDLSKVSTGPGGPSRTYSTVELTVGLARLVIVVHRHLGCLDVSGASMGSVVGLRDHAEGLPVVPLVIEADVPARKVECPEKEVKNDATAVRPLSAEPYLLPVVTLRGSAASSLYRILASAFSPAWFFMQISPAAKRRSPSSDSSGPYSDPDRPVSLLLPLPLAFPPLLMLIRQRFRGCRAKRLYDGSMTVICCNMRISQEKRRFAPG